MEATNHKKKKRKFKQTKQLVRLAINDGWTQTEIAKACRTQQSIVSEWSKGSKQGTEQQLKALLEQYGHKLRRNTFRVYWSIDADTKAKVFHKVEGKVILNQAFYDARRVSHKLEKKIPQYKLTIHYQGNNKFRVVYQSRIIFRPSNAELESIVEDAIWRSSVSKQLELAELLDVIDRYAEITLAKFPSDGHTLPFILRQSLLNHGFQVDGIVEYPAVW